MALLGPVRITSRISQELWIVLRMPVKSAAARAEGGMVQERCPAEQKALAGILFKLWEDGDWNGIIQTGLR